MYQKMQFNTYTDALSVIYGIYTYIQIKLVRRALVSMNVDVVCCACVSTDITRMHTALFGV